MTTSNAPLTNRVALITGSSKGLGKAIALRLAGRGADIVLNYAKDEAPAQQVLKQIQQLGRNAVCVKVDVSEVKEIERLFERAIDAFGRLDIVVANAGIEKVNIAVVDVTEEDFDLLFRINTKGPYFVLQAAARHIADGGRIINISSSSTLRPQKGLGLYGTSKSAPNYLIQVLAQELGARRVTVNSIVPGPIDGAGIFTNVPDTEPYKKSLLDTIPLGQLATADDVADVAEFVASDESFFFRVRTC